MKIKVSIIISIAFCFMMINTVVQTSNTIKINGIVLDANSKAPKDMLEIINKTNNIN